MTTSPDEFAGRYVTEAVESTVLDADREVVGHVGLLDLDGVGRSEAVEVAEALPGPTAVLLTSERSYHVWSLAVDSLDAWVDRTASLDVVDRDHVALSVSRECAVLRIDAKVRLADGLEEKPAPALIRAEDSPTDCPLSEPHAGLLRSEFGADLTVSVGHSWTGHSAERRTYMADIGGRGGR